MKERLIRLFEKIDISIEDNNLLFKMLNLINGPNEVLNKQYELFLMELLVGLNAIKSYDEKAFKRYIDKINETSRNINFWGEKFEINMHARLLRINNDVIHNLRRGRDGIEPDLLFDYKNSQLGFELTTLKFRKPPKSTEVVLKKIMDCILLKNKKPYANQNCSLIIDITNLISFGKLLEFSINDIFHNDFTGFNYLQKEIAFNNILLCNSSFKVKTDKSLTLELNPRIMLKSETETGNENLNEFLYFMFNGFKKDNKTELEFFHLNI